MSVFFPITSNPHFAAVLRRCRTREQRMGVVQNLREDAARQLADLAGRVPRVPEHLHEKYRAGGISTAWNLGDDEQAIEFTLAMQRHRPTASEMDAGAVLRACVAAEEAGDVVPIANELAGIRQSEEQRKRRKDKPATEPTRDPDRNERIRQQHARLGEAGHHDATSQVASDHGLSTRQIRRILSG